MTNCPVCLDVYKDPRVLTSCGHSVCAECLRGVIDQGPSLISVKCPKCREWSRVPINGFPRNYDLADAVANAASVSCSHTVDSVRAPTPTGLGCNACQKEFSQDDHIYECRTCAETLGEVEDGILLCADCALAGHKTHSVQAMEVASSEEIAEAEQLINQFSSGMSFTHEPREVFAELESLCREAQKEVQSLSEVRTDFRSQLRSKERVSKARLSEVVDRAYSTFRAKQSVNEALTEAYKECKSSLEKVITACESGRRELEMPSTEPKPSGSSSPKRVTSAPLPKRTRV